MVFDLKSFTLGFGTAFILWVCYELWAWYCECRRSYHEDLAKWELARRKMQNLQELLEDLKQRMQDASCDEERGRLLESIETRKEEILAIRWKLGLPLHDEKDKDSNVPEDRETSIQ